MAEPWKDFERPAAGSSSDGPWSDFSKPEPAAPAAKPRLTRTWGEAASDTAKAVGSGLGGLLQAGGDLYGLTTGDFDNFASREGRGMRQWYQDIQSDALQQRRADRSAAIEEADGVLGKAGVAIKETLTDPALFTDLVAGNVTSLIPAAGAGRLASGAAGARALLRGATPAVAGREAALYGTGAAIATGAAQQGADVAGSVYDDSMAGEGSDWARNPDYVRRVGEGEDPDAVRQELSLRAARLTFPAAAGISAVSQAVPGGAAIERALVGGAARATLSRPGLPGRAIGAARGALGEGAQEAIEEGGGQYAGNVMRRSVVDPEIALTEGVGESAGLGFVGGLGLGGVAGATSQPRPAESAAPPGSLQDAAETATRQQGPLLQLPPPMIRVRPDGRAASEATIFDREQAREAGMVAFAAEREALGLTPDVNAARARHPAALRYPNAAPGSLADAANSAPAVQPAPTLQPAAAGAPPANMDELDAQAHAWQNEQMDNITDEGLTRLVRSFFGRNIGTVTPEQAAQMTSQPLDRVRALWPQIQRGEAAPRETEASPADYDSTVDPPSTRDTDAQPPERTLPPANLDPETGELLSIDAESWPAAAAHQQPKAIIESLVATQAAGRRRMPGIQALAKQYNIDEATAGALRRRAVRQITDIATRAVSAPRAEPASPAPSEASASAAPEPPAAADAAPAVPAEPDQAPAVREASADGGEAGASASPLAEDRAQDTPATPESVVYDTSEDVLDGDITTPSGTPFTIEDAARRAAARTEGGRVVPVDGGFVVRTPRAVTPDTPPSLQDAAQVSGEQPAESGVSSTESGVSAPAPAAEETRTAADGSLQERRTDSQGRAYWVPAAPAAPALPDGWTESGPGGMATSRDPDSGGIVDRTIADGTWFAVPARGGETLEGFATRAEAIAALQSPASAEQAPATAADEAGGPLPLALAARLQEGHRASGRDVTREQVQRQRDQVAREIETGESSSGGVVSRLRPAAIQKRREQLARLEADLALWAAPADTAASETPRSAAADAPSAVNQALAAIAEGGHTAQIVGDLSDADARAAARAMGFRFSSTAKAPNIANNLAGKSQVDVRAAAERAYGQLATPEQAEAREAGRQNRQAAANQRVRAQLQEAELRRRAQGDMLLRENGEPFKSQQAAKKFLGELPATGEFAADNFGVYRTDGGFALRRWPTTGRGAIEAGFVDQATARQKRDESRAAFARDRGLEIDEFGNFVQPPSRADAQPSEGSVASAAAEAATSPTSDAAAPTDAQKEAGNYKVGRIRINGLAISIENAAGTRRRPEWPPLKDAYGYFRGTVGKDKDHVDVFLTEQATDTSLPIFVVDQFVNGRFDEHKVVMGAATEAAARKVYLRNYSRGWKGLKAITEFTQEEFKAWVADPAKTAKRAAVAKPAPATAATPAPAAPRTAAAEPAIDDFGETLHGARKHLYADGYRTSMAAAMERDPTTSTLSEAWPAPNYAKLLEDGTDPWVVAFVHAARDEVPTKPAKSWRVEGWADQVSALRSFANRLLVGTISAEQLSETLDRAEYAGLKRSVGGRAELYEVAGHDVSLKGVRFAQQHYSIYRGQENVSLWVVEKQQKASAFSNWPRELATGKTREEAIEAFKGKLDELRAEEDAKRGRSPRSGTVRFNIYANRLTREIFIGTKIGKGVVTVQGGFKTSTEARAHLADNAAELEAKLASLRNVPEIRRGNNSPRVGMDHRNGADVSPEQFAEAFGFRGVQFGNYVEGPRRQRDLNEAYDGLMDLAGVLGVEPRALSLNGSLGLAFGARGKGGKRPASAHFEPDNVVINLTKGSGAGSLAHEWWHALDNYFASQRAGKKSFGFATDAATKPREAADPKGMRPEMMRAFQEVMETIGRTGLRDRSARLDALRSDKAYWGTGIEMSARSFESYVIAKLADQGAANDYLANVVSEEAFGGRDDYPYPNAAEIPAVRGAFDDFFATIEAEQTPEGTTRLFSAPPAGEAGSPLSFDRALALKAELTGRWGEDAPRVILVEDAEGFPDSAKTDPGYRRAEGFYDGRATVWLNVTALGTEQRFAEVLAHEAIGHYGVERVVGAKDWDGIVDAIARHDRNGTGAPSVRTAIAAVHRRYGDLSRADFAKEVIAVMAENGARNGLISRVVAAVRRWLRANMPSLATTWKDGDIVDLLAQADSFLHRGRTQEEGRAAVQALAFSRAAAPIRVDALGQRTLEMGGQTFVDRAGMFYLADARGEPRDFRPLAAAAEAARQTGGEVLVNPPEEGARPAWSVVAPEVVVRGAEAVRGRAPGFFSLPPADAVAEIEEVMRAGADATLLERARAQLGDLVPKKVKDQLRPVWLGALTTRHLTELGADYFGNIKLYSEFLAEQGADRNKLQAEGEAIVEGARKWAGKHRAEARALFDLMHDATIDGVDPAEAYQPLQFRYGGQLREATPKNVKEALKALREQMLGRSADNKTDMMAEAKLLRGMPGRERRRRERYAPLVERWNRLPPEAQEIYRQFRDTYQDRSKQVEEGLVARINDTDAPANQKQRLINTIRQQFETQRLQGVYFPLQRFGRFFVAAEKGESNTFLMFENLNQMERAVSDLRKRGFTVTAQGLKSAGKAKDAPSGTFVAEVIETMRKAGVSDKTQDEIYQIYLESLPELSMRKHQIHRKAVPGFDPDAVRAFAFNMHHGAHQLARLRYSHKLQGVLDLLKQQQDAARKEQGADTRKIVAGDAILEELNRRHDWINNPTDSQVTNLVSSFGFSYYLGLTPAAALVNLSQTALVTYPYLASRYGAVKAMNHLLAGTRDAVRTAGNIQKTLTNPEEQRAHQVLQAMGALDKTQAHNLAGIAEGGMTGYNPGWAKAMEIIGWGFHKTEVVNREASGMAAFRLAREAGQSFDEAVKFAADTINDTHFDYTNANRARFMQSGTAKVLLMFRQYSLNMTWHLARMVWQATNGQTPKVKSLARRNLAGILGMSALFSGTLGLPMMGVITGVLNAAAASFGDDDEPWDAETEMRAFLNENLGERAAATLLDGVANQVTGADIAARVGLDDLWIRDADRELDGRGQYYHLLEQAAGPMGGVLKNALVGKQLMDEGHLYRGVETVLPKGLKDVLKAGRYATQGVNNLRGDALIEDPSLYQALLQLGGFTPSQVSRQYDENRSLKNYEQHILDRRRHLMDAYAMAARLGDREAMQSTTRKIAAFSAANPEIAITAKSLRASMKSRARYSAQAEAGIVLNRKLEARLRATVGAD